MLRRLNFTNRVRIKRTDIRISLVLNQGGLEFDADLRALAGYDLPTDALVFLEAYRQTNWMRFYLGRVGALVPSSDCRLTQFDSPEGILFRVKVTPNGDSHKILAEADGITLVASTDQDSKREPLLPTKPADLPYEVYRLDFSGDSPVLLISRSAGIYSDIGRSPAFMSLVYPNIFREILIRVVIIDEHEDDSSFDDWRSRWLRFATELSGVPKCPANAAEKDDKFLWIEHAVTAFSRKFTTIDRFSQFWKEGA